MLNDIKETATIIWKILELRRNAKLSRQQLDDKKLRKFRKLVRRAYLKSPYYNKVIQSYGIDISTCMPSDFPVIDKTTVIQNFDDMVTDRQLKLDDVLNVLETSKDPRDLYLGKYHIIRTSGTSGKTAHFVYSRLDWLKGNAQYYRFLPLTKLFATRRYAYYGAANGHGMGYTSVRAGFRNKARNNIVAAWNAFEPIEKVVAGLNEFQPNALGSYTTALLRLAAEQKAGRLKISPRWIDAFAEQTSELDRAYLSEAFGCEVYNLYGSTENQLMGVASPDSNSMTLRDDDIIYEFNDDHIVTTNLINNTLPLIRYRMNDIIQPLRFEECSPYIRVKSLIGREVVSAKFINASGHEDEITSYFITHEIEGVLRFQLQAISRTEFRIVLNPDGTREEEQILQNTKTLIEKILAKKNMQNLKYDLVVSDIFTLHEKSQKFRPIINVA